MKYLVIWCQLLISFPSPAFAQSEGLPRAYPLEMETYLYHRTYLKITFTRISAKMEKPEEGTLWQLGANEPAELMTTGDLLVGNDTLRAGAYSIFAIPNDTTWILIFNSDVGLFDTYRYNEKMDVLRIEAEVSHENQYSESLNISFSRKGVPDSELNIFWKDLKISTPIRLLESGEN